MDQRRLGALFKRTVFVLTYHILFKVREAYGACGAFGR